MYSWFNYICSFLKKYSFLNQNATIKRRSFREFIVNFWHGCITAHTSLFMDGHSWCRFRGLPLHIHVSYRKCNKVIRSPKNVRELHISHETIPSPRKKRTFIGWKKKFPLVRKQYVNTLETPGSQHGSLWFLLEKIEESL